MVALRRAVVLAWVAALGCGPGGAGTEPTTPRSAAGSAAPSVPATAPPTAQAPLPSATSASAAASTSAAPARRTLRYLALGDSFTIGTGSAETDAFPAVFARTSGCDVTLFNVAKNGFTTSDLITRELPALADFRPDFVTLGIGANDRVRGVPLATYEKNVERILDAILAAGVRPEALVLIPQPDWSKSPAAAEFGPPAELAASIAAMNAALRAHGEKRGARWLDLEPMMREQAARGALAPDRLHPSREAHAAWAEAMVGAVCPR